MGLRSVLNFKSAAWYWKLCSFLIKLLPSSLQRFCVLFFVLHKKVVILSTGHIMGWEMALCLWIFIIFILHTCSYIKTNFLQIESADLPSFIHILLRLTYYSGIFYPIFNTFLPYELPYNEITIETVILIWCLLVVILIWCLLVICLHE